MKTIVYIDGFNLYRPSYTLKQHVTFTKQIRTGVLKTCQFPPTMRDTAGRFHKPATW